MKHPLAILKEDEAEASRLKLQSYGTLSDIPLCLGCTLCNCQYGVQCRFGPQSDSLVEHLAYIMHKGTGCTPIVICVRPNGTYEGEATECLCCCKGWEKLIFTEAEIGGSTL